MLTQEQFLQALPESVLIDGDFQEREVYLGGKFLSPSASQKVWNHSPDGFNWGYGGSGPAQLALAILMRYVDAETAQQYYHQLKFGFIATLPRSDFEGIYNLREIMTNILQSKPTTH